MEVCRSTYKVSGVGGVCNLPGVHGIEGRNLLQWGQTNIASLFKIKIIGHVYHGPPKNLDHMPLQTCGLSSAYLYPTLPQHSRALIYCQSSSHDTFETMLGCVMPYK